MISIRLHHQHKKEDFLFLFYLFFSDNVVREILVRKKAHAHASMAKWTEHTRAEKVAKFGAEKIDFRGRKKN